MASMSRAIDRIAVQNGGLGNPLPMSMTGPDEEALAAQQAEWERANNNLARVMGRPQPFAQGLTSGGASRYGKAGRAVAPPAQALKQEPMGNTYWNNNPQRMNPNTGQLEAAPNNNVELAGMMNRGVQKLLKGDKSGVKEFLKGYNEGPWSSRTDATDVTIDENGGVTLYARGPDGEKVPINNTPVPAEELQNIVGNALTGKNVYQRSPQQAGAGTGLGVGGLTTDAAKATAENRYKTEADILKKMYDAKDEVTGKPSYTQEQLTEQYNKVLAAERAAQQALQSVGSGQGVGGLNPQQALVEANTMLEQGVLPQQVLETMWKLGVDRNTLDRMQSEMMRQGAQFGMRGQQTQAGVNAQPQPSMAGQPTGFAPAPAQAAQLGQGAQQPKQNVGGLQKVRQKILAEEDIKQQKEQQKLANKVFFRKYKELRDKVYRGMAGSQDIEALYEQATPKQRKNLEKLYEVAVRKELRNSK